MSKLTIVPKERIEPFFEYYLVGLLKPAQIASLLCCDPSRVSEVFKNLKRINSSTLISKVKRSQDFYYSIFENKIKDNLGKAELYHNALLQIDDNFLDNLIKKAKIRLNELPDLISEYFDFASPAYYTYYQTHGKHRKLLLY